MEKFIIDEIPEEVDEESKIEGENHQQH